MKVLGSTEWKRGAIYFALAVMETCWLAAWVTLFFPQFVNGPAVATTALIFGILMGGALVVRLLDYLGFELPAQQRIMLVLGFVVALTFVRLRWYGDYGFFNLGWIGALVQSIFSIMSDIRGDVASLAILVVLWWRAISIGSREITHHGVAFSFRLGVILLMANGVVAAFVKGPLSLTLLAFVYFFFALLAVGLSRIDELEQQPEAAVSPFGGFWLSTAVGGTLAVLALAAIVTVLFSPTNAGAAVRFLSPVFNGLEWVLLGLLTILAAIFGPPLEALFKWLLQFIKPLIQRVIEQPTIAVPTPMPVEPREGGTPIILTILNVVVVLAVIALVTFLLFMVVDRYKKRSRRTGRVSEYRIDRDEGSALDAIKNALKTGVDRLSELVDMARQFGAGRKLRAAISIRWIYANLLRVAADAGYARTPSQTPWEFLPTLCRAFVGDDEDLRVITEAYVKTHYGEVPTSEADLDAIRQAWSRVRAHVQASGRAIPAEETT
jgi:hypothetical protein